MNSDMTRNSMDNPPLPMIAAAVSRKAAMERRQRQTGPEPTYPLDTLLGRKGLTPETFAEEVGISRATAYRRVRNGVKWSEADEWAMAFGYLPYEVWPEWERADPADWCDIPADPDGESTADPINPAA